MEQNKDIEILNVSDMKISKLNKTQDMHTLDYSSVSTHVVDKENEIKSKFMSNKNRDQC